VRGKTVQVKCACGCIFTARIADRKRGWAKSCSKSCAARKQTGKLKKYLRKKRADVTSVNLSDNWNFDPMDGHFSNEDN